MCINIQSKKLSSKFKCKKQLCLLTTALALGVLLPANLSYAEEAATSEESVEVSENSVKTGGLKR